MINFMSEPWYQDGLRFECTRCGKCCSGFPGFVWVNEAELQAIAEFRGQPLDEVIGLYARYVNGRRSLRDNLKDDCIFYDPTAGCTIYPVRPRQCRTWPFWESNVQSPETWAKTQTTCPGAGNGELITAEEITRRVKTIKL
jgi:Fe-S-cluster containining protein